MRARAPLSSFWQRFGSGPVLVSTEAGQVVRAVSGALDECLSSSVAIAIGECPVGSLNNPPRESLGASRAGARLSGSAADDEHADDEGEDDELEGDAHGVLEAALQTGIGDGDPYGEGEHAASHQEHAEPARDEAAHDSRSAKSRKATPSSTRK